jgi:hypothetical protein
MLNQVTLRIGAPVLTQVNGTDFSGAKLALP